VGAYHLVVNPVKRQYLDPFRFSEAIKFSGVLQGGHCILALKLLIADCFQPEGTAFRGAWLGDPVVLASDETGVPNAGGIVTMTPAHPLRNLYFRAEEEFTNISYRALAELCFDAEVAKELAARATEDDQLLLELGAVMEQYHLPSMAAALEQAVGRPWRKAYNLAWDKKRYWEPLPPIDWPL
jgi:hypothetical protein